MPAASFSMEFLGGKEEHGDAVAGVREARKSTHLITLCGRRPAAGERADDGSEAGGSSHPDGRRDLRFLSVCERDEKGNGDSRRGAGSRSTWWCWLLLGLDVHSRRGQRTEK
jgi:hypothetical protein